MKSKMPRQEIGFRREVTRQRPQLRKELLGKLLPAELESAGGGYKGEDCFKACMTTRD